MTVAATNADGQRQPVDPGARTWLQGAHLASAKLLASPFEPFTLTLGGRGCTLMTVPLQ